MSSPVAIQMIIGMNDALRHNRQGEAKKPTYKKLKDGTIIIAQTGDKIGTYAHGGSPMPGERFCKIKCNRKSIPVSYIPLDEPAVQ